MRKTLTIIAVFGISLGLTMTSCSEAVAAPSHRTAATKAHVVKKSVASQQQAGRAWKKPTPTELRAWKSFQIAR